MTLKVFHDLEELSHGVASLFAATASRAVDQRGRFSVLVSGGETPLRTYELLAGEPYRQLVPWRSIHVFWGDERCVPRDDPRNNALMVRRALLDKVPLPEHQVHPITCETEAETAALRYESLLRSHFPDGHARFDLAMLGLGDDGHTASLFPGAAELHEQRRWVSTARKPGEEIMRVTLTPAVLNQARRVVFLVAGHSKASMARNVLEGESTPDRFPAQLINPEGGELLWYVEEPAARMLARGKSAFHDGQ